MGKTRLCILVIPLLVFMSCGNHKKDDMNMEITNEQKDSLTFKSGYSEVNGLQMYYEVYGQGKPLVLLHGGGSTIQTSFGRIIPRLATSRQVIGVELQAHGRTGDRDSDISFEQDADDVAALLGKLGIAEADFFGFSNGGTTALQIAIRHPGLVNRIIAGSALSKRNGAPDEFWDFMKQARLEHMPQEYKDEYIKIAPDPSRLQIMHDKCARRMQTFTDIPDEQLQAIKAPTLIITGDRDVMTPEHAVAMHRLISNSKLAIIPGGHGDYIGEITTLKPGSGESGYAVPMITSFLDEQGLP